MKTPNTFLEALNTDLSDFVMKNTMVRLGMNMRLINLESSTYAVTNIRGTEVAFNLTTGYVPLAAKQFDNVLYILSIKSDLTCELGSFGSPDYSGGGGSQEIYRPLHNLDGDVFRTLIFGYQLNSQVKMELQPDYDGSINIILIECNNTPRIINSKINRDPSTGLLQEAPDRPSGASTNDYTSADLEEETKLILSSGLILKIALNSIPGGGKLKYGTYRYYFVYQTEDFNSTEVVGQSGLCQVASGSTKSVLKGGTSSQETDRQVILNLTNVDTAFKYVKVYVLYSAGIEGLEQQMLEFVTPIEIVSSSLTFTHTGFESVLEVDQDVVNVNFQPIDAAQTGAQINGYLVLGGIREDAVDMQAFQDAAQTILGTEAAPQSMSYTGSLSALEGYANPANTYNYLGHMRLEAYPFRVVFILPGGRLTPPFKTKGTDYGAFGSPINTEGLVRLRGATGNMFFDGSSHVIKAQGIQFDLSLVPSNVINASIGFFFVRAERRPNLLAQGYLVPTIMVPPLEDYVISGSPPSYFERFGLGNENLFKRVPCVDNLLEAYQYVDEAGGLTNTVDITLTNKLVLYEPFFIQHFGPTSSPPGASSPANRSDLIDNYPQDSYAFISADSLANEPEVITNISQRTGMYCVQMAIANMRVQSQGNLSPLINAFSESDGVTLSMFYDIESLSVYSPPNGSNVTSCDYVSGETFATGSGFSSRVGTSWINSSGGTRSAFRAALLFNAYFGMKISGLADQGFDATSPRAGNKRLDPAKYRDTFFTAGTGYNNSGTLVPAAFLVNIYPALLLPDPTSTYPDTDSLIYKQVGPRYAWGDTLTPVIYDGDCYIGKFHHKLYQSPFRDPLSPLDPKNIDCGMIVSFIQESKYNLELRNPNRFDASETQDRSFYPYESNGDFYGFRRYRYPETLQVSQGYTPGLGPKSFIPVSSLAPFIQTDFFSRLSASAKHIPNAFANGYRFFGIDSFKDYDPSMGRIIDLQSYRDRLVIVFQHGICAITVESRVLTGSDTSGPVYAQPSGIFPNTLGVYSRWLGAQSMGAVLQTPSAVYGMDAEKKKIWQLRDSLEVISDKQISAFLASNPMSNPRIGYDFKYNEVIFTTDDWTLCFREGLEKFTFNYSFKPTFYASRGAEFFSFFPQSSIQNFHRHDSMANWSIYGVNEDCFVEFTVNEGEGAKVFDVLEIFSNEVTPKKIEFFVDDNSLRKLVIDTSSLIQYVMVDNTVDPFREEAFITFRDKRFIVQIPKISVYNSSLDKSALTWGVEGRMRNKYMTVRLTYNITQALQLMNTLTTFRRSIS